MQLMNLKKNLFVIRVKKHTRELQGIKVRLKENKNTNHQTLELSDGVLLYSEVMAQSRLSKKMKTKLVLANGVWAGMTNAMQSAI